MIDDKYKKYIDAWKNDRFVRASEYEELRELHEKLLEEDESVSEFDSEAELLALANILAATDEEIFKIVGGLLVLREVEDESIFNV